MKWFNECYGVYLFGIYLLLNVLDWLTGWYKARGKQQSRIKWNHKKSWILDYTSYCIFDTIYVPEIGKRSAGYGSWISFGSWLVYTGESSDQ